MHHQSTQHLRNFAHNIRNNTTWISYLIYSNDSLYSHTHTHLNPFAPIRPQLIPKHMHRPTNSLSTNFGKPELHSTSDGVLLLMLSPLTADVVHWVTRRQGQIKTTGRQMTPIARKREVNNRGSSCVVRTFDIRTSTSARRLHNCFQPQPTPSTSPSTQPHPSI